jgi:hypothetical protein
MNDPLLGDIGNENSGTVGDALRQKKWIYTTAFIQAKL